MSSTPTPTTTFPPSPPSHVTESPSVPQYEVRLYGLNMSVTIDHLVTFFAANTKVLGVLIHPQANNSLQWAQVCVSSEADVQKCLDLKQHLAPSGITLLRAPPPAPPAPTLLPAPSLVSTPEGKTGTGPNNSFELQTPPTPPSGFMGRNLSSSLSIRTDNASLGYRHVDPQGPLPRNLYIMGLPLDMTQIQFKALFASYGMVEHSTLLSQLDGMGRRRGFILMSTHREAVEAMKAMNGTWHEMDVSWALVQREAKQFGLSSAMPNRVIHPPTVPTRWEPQEECSVIVENLDVAYFPNAGTIREIFSHFGRVWRVTVLSATPLQVLIQFEHAVSATALINADGLNLGGRPIVSRRYTKAVLTSEPMTTRLPFDPFGDQQTFAQHVSRVTSRNVADNLDVNSKPFVPIGWQDINPANFRMLGQTQTPKIVDTWPSAHTGGQENVPPMQNKLQQAGGQTGVTGVSGITLAQSRWKVSPNWYEPTVPTTYSTGGNTHCFNLPDLSYLIPACSSPHSLRF